MILLVDNYDSFVFNLARYFERLGQPTRVVRNDAIDAAGIEALRPAAVVLSPGPGTPNEAGCSLEVVRRLAPKTPILGVCLGHQTIAAALGGGIVRAIEPMHGRASQILHDGTSIFAGLPSPLTACRYHSLIVERAALPECFDVTAWTLDDTVMAFAHRAWPIVGVQFHPESILTDLGFALLAGFLRIANIPIPTGVPTIDSERFEPSRPVAVVPKVRLTF